MSLGSAEAGQAVSAGASADPGDAGRAAQTQALEKDDDGVIRPLEPDYALLNLP